MPAIDPPQEQTETIVPGLAARDATHIRETHSGLQAEVRDGDVYVRSSRKVGAVGVPSGHSFYIRPKVDCSLLHMLSFSEQIDEDIVLDAEEAGFEFGDSFVDFMAQLYLNELRRIFRRGLDQRYHEKEERVQQLRGRLDLQAQLQQGPATTSFECTFDELTHDTTANQLLYHAAKTLREVVSNSAITGPLRRYCRQFKSAIDPQPLTATDFGELQLSHLNRYYERGIELATFILQAHYVEGFGGHNKDLSSFLIDMPMTFESAVYNRLDGVVSSPQLTVTDEPLAPLATERDGEGTRDLEPDFTIVDLDAEEPLLVGDIKWKDSDGISRNDLYQLFAYQVTTQTPGLVIYPAAGQDLPTRYDFEVDGCRQSLYTLKLDCSDASYEQTKQRIDSAIRNAVDTTLQAGHPHRSVV